MVNLNGVEFKNPVKIMFHCVSVDLDELLYDSFDYEVDEVMRMLRKQEGTSLNSLIKFISDKSIGYTSEMLNDRIKRLFKFSEECYPISILNESVYKNGTVELICTKLFKTYYPFGDGRKFRSIGELRVAIEDYIYCSEIDTEGIFVYEQNDRREVFYYNGVSLVYLCTVYYEDVALDAYVYEPSEYDFHDITLCLDYNVK